MINSIIDISHHNTIKGLRMQLIQGILQYKNFKSFVK